MRVSNSSGRAAAGSSATGARGVFGRVVADFGAGRGRSAAAGGGAAGSGARGSTAGAASGLAGGGEETRPAGAVPTFRGAGGGAGSGARSDARDGAAGGVGSGSAGGRGWRLRGRRSRGVHRCPRCRPRPGAGPGRSRRVVVRIGRGRRRRGRPVSGPARSAWPRAALRDGPAPRPSRTRTAPTRAAVFRIATRTSPNRRTPVAMRLRFRQSQRAPSATGASRPDRPPTRRHRSAMPLRAGGARPDSPAPASVAAASRSRRAPRKAPPPMAAVRTLRETWVRRCRRYRMRSSRRAEVGREAGPGRLSRPLPAGRTLCFSAGSLCLWVEPVSLACVFRPRACVFSLCL